MSKKKKTFIFVTMAAVLILGVTIFVMWMNPGNTDISPLLPATEQVHTGQRLEISFSYEKLRSIASSQFAFWIEDMDGNYVDTLYATHFTAQGGFNRRPTSIAQWVSAAQPANMNPSEIDAISGATPITGDYLAYWDFTDSSGKLVVDTQYRYFIEATMNFDDNLIYSGVITIGEEKWDDSPLPEYSIQDSRYKEMITNVRVSYYPS